MRLPEAKPVANPWRIAVAAGAAYFSLVFPAAFIVGALRTLWLAPQIGEVAAVLIEAPIILVVSWVACGEIIRRLGVSRRTALRAAMGFTSFILLIGAEFGLARLGLARSTAEWLASYRTFSGLIGLAAQLAFAVFPLLRG